MSGTSVQTKQARNAQATVSWHYKQRLKLEAEAFALWPGQAGAWERELGRQDTLSTPGTYCKHPGAVNTNTHALPGVDIHQQHQSLHGNNVYPLAVESGNFQHL